MNTAPWQPLSEAFDMCAAPVSVCVALPLAAMSIVRPVWSVNVTPVVTHVGWVPSAVAAPLPAMLVTRTG